MVDQKSKWKIIEFMRAILSSSTSIISKLFPFNVVTSYLLIHHFWKQEYIICRYKTTLRLPQGTTRCQSITYTGLSYLTLGKAPDIKWPVIRALEEAQSVSRASNFSQGLLLITLLSTCWLQALGAEDSSLGFIEMRKSNTWPFHMVDPRPRFPLGVGNRAMFKSVKVFGRIITCHN